MHNKFLTKGKLSALFLEMFVFIFCFSFGFGFGFVFLSYSNLTSAAVILTQCGCHYPKVLNKLL